jgi:hypothetical protein
MAKNKQLDEILEGQFLTMAKFSMDVEMVVKDSKGSLNYIEAIISYCEDNEIDLETVPKLLSKPLKEKVKADAQKMNYIRKTSIGKLPI